MKRKKKTLHLRKTLTDAGVILLGCLIHGAAVRVFTAPNQIAVGGFTGLATALNHLTALPIGVTVILLNFPLFLFSFRKLGREFFLRTVAATLTLSVTLDLTAGLPVFTEDKLLAALAGGAGAGIGLGLIYLRGAATGGSDLAAKLLRPVFPGLSYGRIILLLDAVILGIAAFIYRDPWTLLYSALTVFTTSRAIDAVQNGVERIKCIQIISDAPEAILREILQSLHRGATVWNARGGYTQKEKTVLFVTVRNYELSRLRRAVRAVDPEAFMTVTDAAEVRGNGFEE